MVERRSFFAELKRRNVLRAAVLYVGAAWALAQGISQLAPALELPDSATRWFLVAAMIGFPFWIGFQWFYEITSKGIRRESEIEGDVRARHSRARALDVAIIAVLTVAVVLLASGYVVGRRIPSEAQPGSIASFKTEAFAPPSDSLVVLPFKNLGGDPKQQYFSDGITQELTSALSQNPVLRVIAWETASTVRDPNLTASEVGRKLNVADVLYGSILREGDQVRITAELVNTVSGYDLWSAHYDGSFAQIFNVQDQVSKAIAHALEIKFAQPDLPGGVVDAQAHELVLKGRALMESATATSLAAAQNYFEQAIAIDPNYSAAHALLSHVLLGLTERSDVRLEPTLPRAHVEAETAITLDPHNADGWVALGNADASSIPLDVAKVRADYEKALVLDPGDAGAHLDYGLVLSPREEIAEEREATQLDPANETAWINLAAAAQDAGDWTQEIEAALALVKLDPEDVDSAFYLAFAYQNVHQYENMVTAFDAVRPATPLDREQVAAGKLTYRALSDTKLRSQALTVIDALATHQANTDVAGNLLQMYLALGETKPALDLLESYCPADPVACGSLAANPVYRALHGNSRFKSLVRDYATDAER